LSAGNTHATPRLRLHSSRSAAKAAAGNKNLLRGLAPGRRVGVVAAYESLIRQVGVHVVRV
jgi:hypothetical protein